MGWIYNGDKFIKANRAQLKAYDKHNNFLLTEATVAAPFTVPAIALAGAAVAGVVTITSLGALFWGPAKDIVDEAIEDIKDLPGEIKEAVVQIIEDAGVSTEEQPKFTTDAVKCLQAHPARITNPIMPWQLNKVKDPLRGLKVLNCMRKKGWAEDIVIAGITQIFI